MGDDLPELLSVVRKCFEPSVLACLALSKDDASFFLTTLFGEFPVMVESHDEEEER
jgi:hypothetical protein